MAKKKVTIEFDADEELAKKNKSLEAKLRRKDAKIKQFESYTRELETELKAYRKIDGALQELAKIAGEVGLIEGEDWYI